MTSKHDVYVSSMTKPGLVTASANSPVLLDQNNGLKNVGYICNFAIRGSKPALNMELRWL